jgi:molecular chaperone DnaK (HSP70)
LGKCTVRDLPPNLPAQTPIEVQFRYEENGRLTVKVEVSGAGKPLEHELMRENSLTPEQLRSWRSYISGLPAPS